MRDSAIGESSIIRREATEYEPVVARRERKCAPPCPPRGIYGERPALTEIGLYPRCRLNTASEGPGDEAFIGICGPLWPHNHRMGAGGANQVDHFPDPASQYPDVIVEVDVYITRIQVTFAQVQRYRF